MILVDLEVTEISALFVHKHAFLNMDCPILTKGIQFSTEKLNNVIGRTLWEVFV